MLNTTLTIILFVVPVVQDQSQFDATLNFHAVHQFSTSIDGGGKVEVTRTGVELRFTNEISTLDDLQIRFQYQQDDWDFSGTGFGALNPWSKITTFDFSVQWTHEFNSTTSWFVGALARSSYEDTFSEGFVVGGTVGVVHSFNSNLTLGLGVGVIEQVIDDTRVFPLFVIEWQLSDTLRLTSDISTRFGSRAGVELEWAPRSDWSLGLGISSDYSRFSLDKTGIAPNGAGEATSYPLTLRATYHASPNFDFTIYGGIVFSGQLEVINSASAVINKQDYSSAGTFGIMGQIRF